jgi:hypothetical protein
MLRIRSLRVTFHINCDSINARQLDNCKMQQENKKIVVQSETLEIRSFH